MGIYEMKKPSRINSFSVTLFLILTIGGYAGWFWFPVGWPRFQLSGIMKGICNDAYRVFDNDQLVAEALKQSKRTGLYLTKESFTFTRVPYTEQELTALGVKDEARPAYMRRGKKAVLEVTFQQRRNWPLFESKVSTFVVHKTEETDLSIVKYDPAPSCGTIASSP